MTQESGSANMFGGWFSDEDKDKIKAGKKWKYSKTAAEALGNIPTGRKFSKTIDAISVVPNGWLMFSTPPTSNKAAYYQAAIAAHGIRLLSGQDSLKGTASYLIGLGNNSSYETSASAIRSASQKAYESIVFKLKNNDMASNDKFVKPVLDKVRGYASLEEIIFAKNLSAQSASVKSAAASVITGKSTQERIKADIKKSFKDTPFTNASQGNAFRAWVNDNHPKWAKNKNLDRKGQYNNKFIKEAWQNFGEAYQEAMVDQAFSTPKPIPTKKSKEVVKPTEMVQISNATDFDEDILGPIEDPSEQGFLAMLESDPEEALKQYWYIPAGALGGVVAIGVFVKLIRAIKG